MRLVSACIGAAASVFASVASAQTVDLVSLSPAFQEKLENELGAAEGLYLRRLVSERVTGALERREISLAPGERIEIVIVDADPNRPTMRQASAEPSLDMINSVSVGGAALRAVLRSADGRVLSEIEHRYFTHSLADMAFYPPLTWTDARRSISAFAEKVADAYAAAQSGR